MKKPLLFHPAAQKEVFAAHQHYAEQSGQAADGFFEELLPAFDRIQQWPTLYPAGPHGTQRLVLSRYPFFVVYRELLDQIQVIAIAHAKRRPGYWARRV